MAISIQYAEKVWMQYFVLRTEMFDLLILELSLIDILGGDEEPREGFEEDDGCAYPVCDVADDDTLKSEGILSTLTTPLLLIWSRVADDDNIGRS